MSVSQGRVYQAGVNLLPANQHADESRLCTPVAWLSLARWSGASLAMAAALVVSAGVMFFTEGPTYRAATQVYIYLHFASVVVILVYGGVILVRVARRILAADAQLRMPAWKAVVGTGLLFSAAAVAVLSNTLQIFAAKPSVSWLELAQDGYTIPEILVTVSLLAIMETNTLAVMHFRRGKLVLLPLCGGISLAQIWIDLRGATDWSASTLDVGSFTSTLVVSHSPLLSACLPGAGRLMDVASCRHSV